jgi:hypothetical protein
MRKHVFGFAIFSFIVGATVLISRLLFFPVAEPEFHVIENQSSSPRKTSCWMRDTRKFEKPKVKIEQAVLDLKTKQLKTFVALQPQIETDKYQTVLLHFFVKDGGKTRYLSSEDVWVKGTFDAKNEAILTSLKWLDESESYDNLYVVPELENDKIDYKENSPAFDYSNAAPVLLSKGKGF